MRRWLSRWRGRLPCSRRGDDQDGSATIEIVLITPLLILLVLAVIQFALAEQAIHAAQSAADTALAAARAQHATAAVGQVEGAAFLAQVGSGVLQNPGVAVTRGAGQVTVTVTGQVESIIPFLHPHVSVTAAGPVEAWTTPGAR